MELLFNYNFSTNFLHGAWNFAEQFLHLVWYLAEQFRQIAFSLYSYVSDNTWFLLMKMLIFSLFFLGGGGHPYNALSMDLNKMCINLLISLKYLNCLCKCYQYFDFGYWFNAQCKELITTIKPGRDALRQSVTDKNHNFKANFLNLELFYTSNRRSITDQEW